jgi:hypothetical protein
MPATVAADVTAVATVATMAVVRAVKTRTVRRTEADHDGRTRLDVDHSGRSLHVNDPRGLFDIDHLRRGVDDLRGIRVKRGGVSHHRRVRHGRGLDHDLTGMAIDHLSGLRVNGLALSVDDRRRGRLINALGIDHRADDRAGHRPEGDASGPVIPVVSADQTTGDGTQHRTRCGRRAIDLCVGRPGCAGGHRERNCDEKCFHCVDETALPGGVFSRFDEN